MRNRELVRVGMCWRVWHVLYNMPIANNVNRIEIFVISFWLFINSVYMTQDVHTFLIILIVYLRLISYPLHTVNIFKIRYTDKLEKFITSSKNVLKKVDFWLAIMCIRYICCARGRVASIQKIDLAVESWLHKTRIEEENEKKI